MSKKINRLQQIKEQLEQSLKKKDLEAKINIKQTSLGWLYLHVITSCFEGKAEIEREEQIDAALEKLNLNLGGFPFINYMLHTPQEASEYKPIQSIQLPLWSEVLMAPDPDVPVSLDEDTESELPFIITFYSFKGGVGRSTALGFVANILVTRGYRVVMIDFDLEAPGLSLMFPPGALTPDRYGVLDYLYQRFLSPDQNLPTITECIRRIETSGHGELYLIPAGEYNENDEGYIHCLADLDMHLLYQLENNPVHQLLDDVKTSLEPDIILLDARTGFTEMGAIALLDQADLGVICFSPTTEQSFVGLKWVVKAASKQRSYRGIPDLRFLLTPMPAVAAIQQQVWIARVAEWIANNWEIPPSVTIDELYYQVPYNPNITTLASLSNDMPPGIPEAYIPLADAITASVPEKRPPTPRLAEVRQQILDELEFQTATAQEIDSAEIPNIFQRTADFSKFLQDRTWLVCGAKGTGKTLLFRLFVERSDDAKRLAAEKGSDLHALHFIPGHGQAGLRNTLLISTDLISYERQAGEDSWTLFWLNYMLLQLIAALPEVRSLPSLDSRLVDLSVQHNLSHAHIIAWLVERALSPTLAPQAHDELRVIDQWLKQHNQRVWLLYDELDAGFGDTERRRRSLDSLLGWWIESGSSLTNIVPKILLREDIWSNLNFTNKAYYATKMIQLRWNEEDLWRVVLRQALDESRTFTRLIDQQLNVGVKSLDNTEGSLLLKCLYPLWGERMGSRKAYTQNWIRNRIKDWKNNLFPRSLVLLLQDAINIENAYRDRNPPDVIIRPRSLIEALPKASLQRVEEVGNEYPEFKDLLDKFAGERSPIALNRLSEIWGLETPELKSKVNGMIEAGILKEYDRLPDDIPRYSVPELYLYGLKMKRPGQP